MVMRSQSRRTPTTVLTTGLKKLSVKLTASNQENALQLSGASSVLDAFDMSQVSSVRFFQPCGAAQFFGQPPALFRIAGPIARKIGDHVKGIGCR